MTLATKSSEQLFFDRVNELWDEKDPVCSYAVLAGLLGRNNDGHVIQTGRRATLLLETGTGQHDRRLCYDNLGTEMPMTDCVTAIDKMVEEIEPHMQRNKEVREGLMDALLDALYYLLALPLNTSEEKV